MIKTFLKQRLTLFIFSIVLLINAGISCIKGMSLEKVDFFYLDKNTPYILRTIANIGGDKDYIASSSNISIYEGAHEVLKPRYEYPSIEVGVLATDEIIKKLKFTDLEGANNCKVRINNAKIESKTPLLIGGFNYYQFELYLSVDKLPKGIYLFDRIKYTFNGKTYAKEILCYMEVLKEKNNYDFLGVGGYSQQKYGNNRSIEDILAGNENGYIGDEWEFVYENMSRKNLRVMKIDVPRQIYPLVKCWTEPDIPSDGYLLKPGDKIQFRVFIPKDYSESYHIIMLSPRILYKEEGKKGIKVIYQSTRTGSDLYRAIERSAENLRNKIAR